MSEAQVSLHEDLNHFFGDVLNEVLQSHTSRPSAPICHYLVGVLADSAKIEPHKAEAWLAPLPVRLHAALDASPVERFERLRGLGDDVLLVSGFFHEHLEHIGVEDSYVERMGASAYRAASSLLSSPGSHPAGANILLEMASGFGHFAQILREVAVQLFGSVAHGPSHLVHLCERWLQSGGAHVARVLRARGVSLPTAGRLAH